MAKDLKVSITVNIIPHSNPKSAIDLLAEIVFRQLATREKSELAHAMRKAG